MLDSPLSHLLCLLLSWLHVQRLDYSWLHYYELWQSSTSWIVFRSWCCRGMLMLICFFLVWWSDSLLRKCFPCRWLACSADCRRDLHESIGSSSSCQPPFALTLRLLSKIWGKWVSCWISIASRWSCSLPSHHSHPCSTKNGTSMLFVQYLSCCHDLCNTCMVWKSNEGTGSSRHHYSLRFWWGTLCNTFLSDPSNAPCLLDSQDFSTIFESLSKDTQDCWGFAAWALPSWLAYARPQPACHRVRIVRHRCLHWPVLVRWWWPAMLA